MALFSRLKDDETYRNSVIQSLTGGIPDNHVEILVQILLYVVNEKYQLFDSPDLQGHFYNDEEDEISDLILPTVRRLYGKTFIKTPSLFTSDENGLRYKLFVLYFNIDEFIDYMIDMLRKSKSMLQHFEYIDKTAETLTLIVDNYVARNIKRVRECQDLNKEVMRMEREAKIKDLLND